MPNRNRKVPRSWLATRWFVDERGSTILAAALSIVLTVTILATGLQWYWVSSSSCDIQSVADLGALAGADAIAKTVTVIQVLDFLLLSMNIVAVVLHVVVIVSGVVMVTSAPVGGASMVPIFQKALEFDRKFIDIRKRLANEAYNIANVLSNAAPYLAMGQSHQVIRRNSDAVGSRIGTSFSGAVIPFPLKGEVTLSSMPANEAELVNMAGSTNGSNSGDAAKLAELEKQLEGARLACWEADVFRSASTPLYGWSPELGIVDFEQKLGQMGAGAPEASLPDPVGGTSWSSDVLADCYRADYADIGKAIQGSFSSVAGNRSGGYLNPGSVTVNYLLEGHRQGEVYLLPHEEGERKAYHARSSCSGLSNASEEPDVTRVSELVGDDNHPPCSLCTPLHWAAVREWDNSLHGFVSAWNSEASAIRNHEAIREEMSEIQGRVASRTSAALGQVLDSVGEYLKGGRLTYRPAGSRGLVCVVTATTTRGMPAFTLPAATGASERTLGPQVALAGANLSSGGDGSAAAQAVSKLSADVGTGRLSNLSGSVMVALGLSDGLSGAVAPLWRAGVAALQGQPDSMRNTFDSLPWGLGAIVRQFMEALIQQAGLAKPDTRQVVPILTSVSVVGDPSVDGWEGQFARAIRGARTAYGKAGELLEITSSLGGAGQALYDGAFETLLGVEGQRLMGKAFKVPFDDWSIMDGMAAAGYAAGGLGRDLSSQ